MAHNSKAKLPDSVYERSKEINRKKHCAPADAADMESPMKPSFDNQFRETFYEQQERQKKRRVAMQKCFKECRAGKHMDLEAGCVSKCETWESCQGWRAYN